MTIEQAIAYANKFVNYTESRILVSYVTEIEYGQLTNYITQSLTEEQELKIKHFLNERIEKKRPIQYITKCVNFYGLDLYVDERVLIPRFETEELVDNTIKTLKERFQNPKVLDLCCGSGAIGLSIKSKIKGAEVYISDISKDALEVARINKEKLNLDVTIIESDLFDNINDKFDCIISNPPYISEDEEIEEIVKENEPHLALYGGIDGLDFYKKIINDSKEHLKDKFLLAFEIGKNQKEKITEIVNKNFQSIQVCAKKDLSGNDRMIFVERK